MSPLRAGRKARPAAFLFLLAAGMVQAQNAAPVPAPAGAAAPAADAASAVGEFYGPVKPAETLWSIAARMRPDKSVVTEQVLVALYRANPRAFEGSINSLAKGAVLRVPSRDEITALNAAQARAELRRLWSAVAAPAEAGGRPLIDPLQIAPPPPAAVVEQGAAVPAEPPPDEPAATTDAAAPADTAPDAAADASAAAAPSLPPAAAALPTPAAPVAVAPTPFSGQAHSLLWPLVAALLLLTLLVQILRSRRRARRRTGAAVPDPAPRPAPPIPVPPAAAAEAAEPAPVPATPIPEPPPAPVAEAAGAAAVFEQAPARTPLAAEPISTDEIGTKLDLARAYLEMGETRSARALLREVMQQGDAAQRADAEALSGRLQEGT